jgi:hypothetical protein
MSLDGQVLVSCQAHPDQPAINDNVGQDYSRKDWRYAQSIPWVARSYRPVHSCGEKGSLQKWPMWSSREATKQFETLKFTAKDNGGNCYEHTKANE